MQQHSGEHLVSGLIHARFGYENVGFHLGADLVTIDFNGEVDEAGPAGAGARRERGRLGRFCAAYLVSGAGRAGAPPIPQQKSADGCSAPRAVRRHRPVRLLRHPCGPHGRDRPHQAVQHDAFPRRLAHRDGLRRPRPCHAERPVRAEPRHLRPPVGKARADGRRRGTIGLRADGGAAARRRAGGPPVCPAGAGQADAPL